MHKIRPIRTVEYDPFIKSQLASATKFRAVCGANLVTYPSKFEKNETRELHRVEPFLGKQPLELSVRATACFW